MQPVATRSLQRAVLAAAANAVRGVVAKGVARSVHATHAQRAVTACATRGMSCLATAAQARVQAASCYRDSSMEYLERSFGAMRLSTQAGDKPKSTAASDAEKGGISEKREARDTQNAVQAAQTKIRQIDMSLSPSVKQYVTGNQSFVYSRLAGCMAFLSGTKWESSSKEVQAFAKNTVEPTVKECLQAIDTYKNDLHDTKLQLALLEHLDKVMFFPEKIDFQTVSNMDLIRQIQSIITVGSYKLYKNNQKDKNYYSGVIEIPDLDFLKTTKTLEDAGYRKNGDMVGSSANVKGHISTMEPAELARDYHAVMEGHAAYTKASSQVALKPVSLKVGAPQSGRLSRVVAIHVDVDHFDAYRKTCGLGQLRFPPHISVFSQEIQPIDSLKAVSIIDFLRRDNNVFFTALHKSFQHAV